MSKVTAKRQVTIPKVIAEHYGIRPGTQLVFEPAGDSVRVRVLSERQQEQPLDIEFRVALFDEASSRQAERNHQWPSAGGTQERIWTREELYNRGLPR